MPLTHPDRLEPLLGRYAVGDARCLVDPGLVAVAQDYRRQASARLQPLDEAGLKKKLPTGVDYHVSLKIDGEFNILVYDQGEAILVNPGGTVRTGLPCLESIALVLGQNPLVQRLVLAGELYYRTDGRSRVHDITRVARNPQSHEELERLRFAAFDVLDYNGEPV